MRAFGHFLIGRRSIRVALTLLMLQPSLGASPESQPANAVRAWTFNQASKWNGWSPNGQITRVRFDPDCITFHSGGHDPSISGPSFGPIAASNAQHVEIDIDCDAAGEGELFYTNTTSGTYGGFEGKWYVPVAIPSAGRQIVPVWPFWETLGSMMKIRFDPPGNKRCRLYGIQIVSDEPPAGLDAMSPTGAASAWQSMYAARLERSGKILKVQALQPMALVATAVQPFAAQDRSILHMDLECPGEHAVCLYWATRESPGLWGEPIELAERVGQGGITLDLRRHPEWKGTITNLAIGFGTSGHETLTIRSFRIDENSKDVPFLRVKSFGFASGVGRPGKIAELRAIIEHAGGPPLPACEVTIRTDANASSPNSILHIPALAVGARTEVRATIVPHEAGRTRVTLALNGQTFGCMLKVDPSYEDQPADGYEVPAPRPVKSDYQIGVYYYPGWSDPELKNWKKQADLPERDPLLGWYREGRPEVADWHIKWALENGISFFIYDWYWRDGKVQLQAGLEEGLLHARYGKQMKFAVMWANHRPFSNHTREQLAAVTDYWIAHYLKQPNYLTVEGKPYVSFYCPHELLDAFHSPDAVRAELDLMRERVHAAGLPGLHIGAVDIPGQLEPATLKRAGFDSLTLYTYPRTGSTVQHSLYRQYLAGYEPIWRRSRDAKQLPYVPAMSVGWDGPVWYGPRSERRRGRRPEDLAEGLTRLKAFLDETGQKMAILEAWNEWGEGAYLEPNVEFGFSDLESVRKVFARQGEWPVNIGPDDVGLRGRYDQRFGNSATQPTQATKPGS